MGVRRGFIEKPQGTGPRGRTDPDAHKQLMSAHPQLTTPPTQAKRALTVPYLVWFSAPLALTFLMMSGAAPLVSNGITWMHGAEGERIHLSAFLMTFVTALFIYSPMFTARNVATRTVADRRSMRTFTLFYAVGSLISGTLLILVSQSDLIGHLMFGRLLGASSVAENLAREGLLAFVPIPLFVALRGLGQGCHITNGQTWYVGAGTLLRFSSMAVFVFGYAVHTELTGPVLGGLTYLTGIGAETAFVLLTLVGKRQWRTHVAGTTMDLAGYFRYAGPLMLGSLLQQLAGPVLIFMINRAHQPVENGATYNLIRDTIWIVVSMLMAVQPAVIAHATSRHNFHVVLKFAAVLLVAITAVTVLLAFTSLREFIFVRWMEVDNAVILGLTFTALFWLIPVPTITAINHLVNALHTRSGRTIWVTAGNVAGMAGLLTVALTLDLASHEGVILAVAGNAGFQLISAAVQVIGLRRGGLRAAMSDTLLPSEHTPAASAVAPPTIQPELAVCQVTEPARS